MPHAVVDEGQHPNHRHPEPLTPTPTHNNTSGPGTRRTGRHSHIRRPYDIPTTRRGDIPTLHTPSVPAHPRRGSLVEHLDEVTPGSKPDLPGANCGTNVEGGSGSAAAPLTFATALGAEGSDSD